MENTNEIELRATGLLKADWTGDLDGPQWAAVTDWTESPTNEHIRECDCCGDLPAVPAEPERVTIDSEQVPSTWALMSVFSYRMHETSDGRTVCPECWEGGER